METMTQPKINGYRQLSDEEAALINEIKSQGEKIEELIEKLRSMNDTDKRWVSIGATDMQTGLMALVRSVAKPNSF